MARSPLTQATFFNPLPLQQFIRRFIVKMWEEEEENGAALHVSSQPNYVIFYENDIQLQI